MTYGDMIAKAILELKGGRKGSSRYAIKKYINANYKVGPRFDTTFSTQIKRLTATGALVQTGQSFKLSETAKKRYK